jgi:hypothetical protein
MSNLPNGVAVMPLQAQERVPGDAKAFSIRSTISGNSRLLLSRPVLRTALFQILPAMDNIPMIG